MKCRFCQNNLKHKFLDLGFQPLSNGYLSFEDLSKSEVYLPLRLMVCEKCFLVQTEDYSAPSNIFNSNYAYFSSTSKSWLKHAEDYFQLIKKNLDLNKNSLVIEIASNDGYLLQYFNEDNIPCLGIEPTSSTANISKEKGIPTLQKFFNTELALELKKNKKYADLVIGNNVLAHVPNINDFINAISIILKKEGVVTLEFPHLMRLVESNQFDTVYHEHFSYLSLTLVNKVFQKNNLRIFDVEELSTHGGSLRVYGVLKSSTQKVSDNVGKLLNTEKKLGMNEINFYKNFQLAADNAKNNLIKFLINAKEEGKLVYAYGAAAKGNTILNYAGIKPDLLPLVCDAAKSKQKKFLPGSHIPICEPGILFEKRPDYILILPWNIKHEILEQLAELSKKGTKFITAIPTLKIE